VLKFLRSFRNAPVAKRVADVDDAAPLRLTIVLKPSQPVDPLRHVRGGAALSHAQYKAQHGTDTKVIEQLRHFATAHGLHMEPPDPGMNQVVLTGTMKQGRAAFQPDQLGIYEANGHRFVSRSGHLHLPEALADHVVAIMGFDQRPVAHTHYRHRGPHAQAAHSQVSYLPKQVATRYSFPAGTGLGQTIALIELGGGYTASQIASYFTKTGIHRTGTLTAVSVDGATNSPGNPSGPDGEVQLDIEVAGAIAPAANIVVYFAPNQGSGFQDAIATALADTTHSPSVMSISWGGPENGYAPQDLDAINQTLAKAVALGVTVCVASGDQGASDGAPHGKHVDFPASSPYVLGCGGTTLPAHGTETAWNTPGGGATGGGYSVEFSKATWQVGNAQSHRGVPDVAGDADPDTGYEVSVDGASTVIGGTSAVAPLWAGLVATLNQIDSKRYGFINPALYANPGALTDITTGNNNGYNATKGWDPVTGLGSPIGTKVQDALRGFASNPQVAAAEPAKARSKISVEDS
jgi:kumamolisin